MPSPMLVLRNDEDMQTIDFRPTGRRKITPAIVEARAERPTSYGEESKGRVLSAFKYASAAMGVPRRVVDLIDYLVGLTRPVDWEAGAQPRAWPSNAALEDYLHLGRTQVKYLIRTARELGLIEIEERGNGNRFGYRDHKGRIVDACGFDLSPLVARCAEFRQAADAHYARRREGKRLRGLISGMRSEILSLAEFAVELGAAGDWKAVCDQAQALGSMRGKGYDPADLAPIVAMLGELLDGAKEVVQASVSSESDPLGPENRPPITSTNPANNSHREKVGMDGPSRPEAHPLDRRRREPASPTRTADGKSSGVGKREGVAGSALRGFQVSPSFLVRIAPPFAAWTQDGKETTWGDLMVIAEAVRKGLGISPDAWRQALATFGTQDAIAVLAVIAARDAANQVASPGGLLRRMAELHISGDLRLDKTLFGLADGIGEARH